MRQQAGLGQFMSSQHMLCYLQRPVHANPVPGCNHNGTAPAAGFDKPAHLPAFEDQGADIAHFHRFVAFSAQYILGHPYGGYIQRNANMGGKASAPGVVDAAAVRHQDIGCVLEFLVC